VEAVLAQIAVEIVVLGELGAIVERHEGNRVVASRVGVGIDIGLIPGLVSLVYSFSRPVSWGWNPVPIR
jgi:hypothetical protein